MKKKVNFYVIFAEIKKKKSIFVKIFGQNFGFVSPN